MITVTVSGSIRGGCKHSNGWYVNVKFWVFKKRVFVCSDCGEVLEAK